MKTRSEIAEELTSKLGKLLEEQLKDVYWAEKALMDAIPKMVEKATDTDLKKTLENHLAETEEHVTRVERAFSSIGKAAVEKKCDAMEGLIMEAEKLIGEADDNVMRDAAIIAAAQKVEHYEIACYGTLRTYAETLGLEEATKLFELTLEDEKKADASLTQVAMTAVNLQAASET